MPQKRGRRKSGRLPEFLLAAVAVFTWGCSQEDIPVAPACDNHGAAPCGDCDSANPAHTACYDAFTLEVLPIFKMYCLGCHSTDGIGEFQSGGSDSGVNFESGQAYQRLMMPSFGDHGATRRVIPGHPEASALYNKITSDANAVWFGLPMPQGKALLHTDSTAVETIRKWIAGGARPPAGFVSLLQSARTHSYTRLVGE